MQYTVFIDGEAGTTGLQLHTRLSGRSDIRLLKIDPSKRKDIEAKKALINRADIVFLCLPDAAAKESVSLVQNPDVCIIDASTAHRTDKNFTYGFPELSAAHRAAIEKAKRITNPGCHATGFIAAVYPLVALGILPQTASLICHSITGYSGGGKKMVAAYESEDRPLAFESPRQYGLDLCHKHLPEMTYVTGLTTLPIFNPIVGDFYAGMAVSVPLHREQLRHITRKEQLLEALSDYYAGQRFVTVHPQPESGFIPANSLCGTNELKLYVCGNDRQYTLVSQFDNLGKGASGAAVQNMNIALGLPENAFLN